MPSGPMHDSAEMARAGVPTIMMFVPSLYGLSHTHIEDTAFADLELGVAAFDDLPDSALKPFDITAIPTTPAGSAQPGPGHPQLSRGADQRYADQRTDVRRRTATPLQKAGVPRTPVRSAHPSMARIGTVHRAHHPTRALTLTGARRVSDGSPSPHGLQPCSSIGSSRTRTSQSSSNSCGLRCWRQGPWEEAEASARLQSREGGRFFCDRPIGAGGSLNQSVRMGSGLIWRPLTRREVQHLIGQLHPSSGRRRLRQTPLPLVGTPRESGDIARNLGCARAGGRMPAARPTRFAR